MTRRILLHMAVGLAAILCASRLMALATDNDALSLKLQAQLIWGTNDEKPAGKPVKDVDPALKDRLGKVFKWKNYFEVKSEKPVVKPGEVKRVKMSEKCELELRVVDDFTLEVKLFGEGKLTKTVRQSIQALRQGEISVLAGDLKEKYGDAWFVVLSLPKKP